MGSSPEVLGGSSLRFVGFYPQEHTEGLPSGLLGFIPRSTRRVIPQVSWGHPQEYTEGHPAGLLGSSPGVLGESSLRYVGFYPQEYTEGHPSGLLGSSPGVHGRSSFWIDEDHSSGLMGITAPVLVILPVDLEIVPQSGLMRFFHLGKVVTYSTRNISVR